MQINQKADEVFLSENHYRSPHLWSCNVLQKFKLSSFNKHLFFNFRKTAMSGKKISFSWMKISFIWKEKTNLNRITCCFSVPCHFNRLRDLFGLWFQSWELCKFCVEWNLISLCLVFFSLETRSPGEKNLAKETFHHVDTRQLCAIYVATRG